MIHCQCRSARQLSGLGRPKIQRIQACCGQPEIRAKTGTLDRGYRYTTIGQGAANPGCAAIVSIV
jgi:hypothetical protein